MDLSGRNPHHVQLVNDSLDFRHCRQLHVGRTREVTRYAHSIGRASGSPLEKHVRSVIGAAANDSDQWRGGRRRKIGHVLLLLRDPSNVRHGRRIVIGCGLCFPPLVGTVTNSDAAAHGISDCAGPVSQECRPWRQQHRDGSEQPAPSRECSATRLDVPLLPLAFVNGSLKLPAYCTVILTAGGSRCERWRQRKLTTQRVWAA